MTQRSLRGSCAALVTVALLAGALVGAAPPARSSEDALSADTFRTGLERDGRVVRSTAVVTVTRVFIGSARDDVVYRVRIEGRFPPRALRYVVTAGGARIGYGVPNAPGTAVETVTRSDAVLHEPIGARYEGGALPAPSGSPPPGATGYASIANPAKPGPFEVSAARYDLGDEVFQPTDLGAKVELAGKVTYPTDLDAGPFPLVVFLHGNHSACFRRDRVKSRWPCPDGWRTMPNHLGYDYAAAPLASHGVVVVSISANGVNVLGNRLEDSGMRQRGELVDRHLRLWARWSSEGSGVFGDRFIGALDMTRIGTMGHSRGGEGVVWHKIVDDERAEPFGVDAVFALAPVDFTRVPINRVPFAVVLPHCDGDVWDLQGVHFFDDSRYNLAGDPAPKHALTMYGANHNSFNEVWAPSSPFPGTFDDAEYAACGEERLRERRQQRLGAAYITGFFRRYLHDDLGIDPMWTGVAIPGFAEDDELRPTYHAPDLAAHRKDLARFTEASDLQTNHLGGPMLPVDLTRYAWCADTARSPCLDRDWRDFDIHRPGLGQAIFGWEETTAEVGMPIPAGQRDVSGYDALQFRAVVPPGYDANEGRFQDLEVALLDVGGGEASIAASSVGNQALAIPNRRFFGHIIFHQVRFPLDRFEGVDLTRVRRVELRFSRSSSGTLHAADLAFSSGGAVLPKS